jgi:hypothetical protein
MAVDGCAHTAHATGACFGVQSVTLIATVVTLLLERKKRHWRWRWEAQGAKAVGTVIRRPLRNITSDSEAVR